MPCSPGSHPALLTAGTSYSPVLEPVGGIARGGRSCPGAVEIASVAAAVAEQVGVVCRACRHTWRKWVKLLFPAPCPPWAAVPGMAGMEPGEERAGRTALCYAVPGAAVIQLVL